MVFDDISRNSDARIERERRKTAAELLRFGTNGEKHVIYNRSESTSASLVFTAETGRGFSEYSEITRCCRIDVTERITGWDKRERDAAAIVLRGWLSYILPRLKDELNLLANQLRNLPEETGNRLMRSYVYISWAQSEYVTYLHKLDILDKEQCKNLFGHLNSALDYSQDQQLIIAKQSQSLTPKGNLAWQIMEIYRENGFHIVKKKSDIKGQTDCLLKDGHILLVTSSNLMSLLQDHFWAQSITKKYICKKLREFGAIPSMDAHSEKRSAGKRISGIRYLEIDLNILSQKEIKY